MVSFIAVVLMLVFSATLSAAPVITKPPIPTQITDTSNNAVIGTFPKDTQITVTHQADGSVLLKQGTTTTIRVPASVVRFGVQYLAACGQLPAPETRPGDPGCPAGTHGTYTQTRTYTTAPPPQCAIPGPWLPPAPPDGTCQPDVIVPPTNIELTFDHFYPQSFRLSTDTTSIYSYVRYPKPAKSSGITSPSYTDASGVKVFRAVDRTADCSSTGGDHCRHEYSTHGAFSKTSKYFLVEDGQGFWFVLDANTFQKISQGSANNGALPGFAGDCEAFWSPDTDDEIWRTANSGGMQWYKYNLVTKQTTVLFDLTGRMPAGMNNVAHLWFKGEGRPSNDGRYFGLLADRADWSNAGTIMYDRVANQIIGWCSNANNGCPRPDNTKTSPLGNFFFLAYYDATLGGRACPRNYQGTDVMQCVKTTFAEIEHGDLCLNSQGQEVLFQNDYSTGPENGYMRESLLSTGQVLNKVESAPLYPGNNHSATGTHISCVMSEKHPGWALVNFEGSSADYNRVHPDPIQYPMYDRIGFVNMDTDEIRWIGQHTSSGNPYFAEPQATSNKDATRVLVASPVNYRDGAPSSQAESYMYALPSWILTVSNPVQKTLTQKSILVSDSAMKGHRPINDNRKPIIYNYKPSH